MGVHGLTTYLRENQRALGTPVRFSLATGTPTTIVVDGWSFIYELYEQSRLPWVYGGEYDAFSRHAVQVVQAWIAVGLDVYFVFDGASPELKIPTLVSRLNRGSVQNSLLFFRTSPTSRSNPRFLHENRIIPPLVFQSCVETLNNLAKTTRRLEVHFADEEGDPYAVELAGRLGAYVVGNDSDFVILNSGHYAGYIALGEMLWVVPTTAPPPEPHENREDGFQTVANKTKKRPTPVQQRSSFGLIPPRESPPSDLVLSAFVYTPSTLASHLKLPTTLLPLLASLVGNDFTNKSTTQRNVQSLFFEKNLTLSQRITHTSNVLSSILNAATQKRNAKYRVGSVMDLIDRTVSALLVRLPTSLVSGEIDGIVDRIVNAALQYAIDKYEGDVCGPASLWPTPICALHGSDSCPLPKLFSRKLSQIQKLGIADNAPTEDMRSLYLKAFRAGKLQPEVMDVLSTGTFWPTIFLDNPDIENVAISIGRPIRLWIYALLDDSVGLPEAQEEEEAKVRDGVSERNEAEEDPDELIDVVEEHSDGDADLLAPLRGELCRIRGAGQDTGDAAASSRSRSRPPARPKCVTEYVRRGTRIAAEPVPVPDLASLIVSSGFNESIDPNAWVPVQLWNSEERMALFLHILGSNMAAVKDVPPDRLMVVVVLRWIAQTLHQRAVESGMSKDREKERWTRQEAWRFLAFYGSPPSGSVDDTASQANGTEASASTAVPQTDRNVQLVAQVLMAIETIYMLSQVMFLVDRVPANIQTLSGQRLHAFLTNPNPIPAESFPPELWDACKESMEDAFTLEKQKKPKTPKMVQKLVVKAEDKSRSGQGLFSVLGDEAA